MTRAAFCVVAWRDYADRGQARAQAAITVARAVGMRDVFMRAGLAILSSHPASWFEPIGGGCALIIGEAFGAGLSRAARCAEGRSPDVFAAGDAAQAMTDAIWGGYAAVLADADGVALFADPSGALPFDMIESEGVAIATDDLTPALCRAIGHGPRIDWSSLVATLIAPATAVHLPHLIGVRPAIPGRLHRLGETRRDRTIWSPSRFASRDEGYAGSAMRTAVDRSAAALGRATTAVQLSGGLDSSIVLSSLCKAVPPRTAITFATRAAGGDERRYAQLIADHCATPLIACAATRLPSYAGLFTQAPGAHPFIYGLDDAFEEAVANAAIAAGCDRLLTGQGGDAVFFQPVTPLVAVDRVRAFGFGARALRPLVEDARRARSSIWHHLLPAIADRFRPASVPTQRTAERLLTTKARVLIGAGLPHHPWLDDATDLPPGKAMHLTMLANSQIFHARRPDPQGLDLRHPLLTQPVMEAVLPIPVYDLVIGTNDRGLARTTFSDRLPAAIVHRRGKGDAADHYSRAALANLPFLRTMLLDGILVGEGLVDRGALDAVLTREHLFYSLDYRALVMHATCEAWARYWAAG